MGKGDVPENVGDEEFVERLKVECDLRLKSRDPVEGGQGPMAPYFPTDRSLPLFPIAAYYISMCPVLGVQLCDSMRTVGQRGVMEWEVAGARGKGTPCQGDFRSFFPGLKEWQAADRVEGAGRTDDNVLFVEYSPLFYPCRNY